MQPSPTSYDLKIYDHLLQFVFFQGLSRGELLQLAGNTKFLFSKIPAGRTLASEGTPCHELDFLISGSLELTTRSADGGYSLSERLSAPWMIQPEALFGATPRYTATWKTLTECQFITLHKDEVLRLLNEFLIIRLNLLNILSTQAQKSTLQQWRRAPGSLAERFIRFLAARAVYPAGYKELRILMTRLATELGSSRLDVSHMLNSMQDNGMLTLHRGMIEIPSLERLIQHLC